MANHGLAVINEADEWFVTGGDCLAVIEKDQKTFELENMFCEVDAANCSESSNRSWSIKSHISMTPPSLGNLCRDDQHKSSHQVSIGSFIAEKTETLGSLDGQGSSDRPTFGIRISTPPPERKPFALLDEFDESSIYSSDEFGDETLTPHKDDEDTDYLVSENSPSSSLYDQKGELIAPSGSVVVTNKWNGARNRLNTVYTQHLDRIEEVSIERSSSGSSNMATEKVVVEIDQSIGSQYEFVSNQVPRSGCNFKEVMTNLYPLSSSGDVQKIGNVPAKVASLTTSVSKFSSVCSSNLPLSNKTISFNHSKEYDHFTRSVIDVTNQGHKNEKSSSNLIPTLTHPSGVMNVPPPLLGATGKTKNSGVTREGSYVSSEQDELIMGPSLPSKSGILDITDLDRNSMIPDFLSLPPSISKNETIAKFQREKSKENQKSSKRKLQQEIIFKKIKEMAATGELSTKFRNALSSTSSRLNSDVNENTDLVNHTKSKGKENTHQNLFKDGSNSVTSSSSAPENDRRDFLQKPGQNLQLIFSNRMIKPGENNISTVQRLELSEQSSLKGLKTPATEASVLIQPVPTTNVTVSGSSMLPQSSVQNGSQMCVSHGKTSPALEVLYTGGQVIQNRNSDSVKLQKQSSYSRSAFEPVSKIATTSVDSVVEPPVVAVSKPHSTTASISNVLPHRACLSDTTDNSTLGTLSSTGAVTSSGLRCISTKPLVSSFSGLKSIERNLYSPRLNHYDFNQDFPSVKPLTSSNLISGLKSHQMMHLGKSNSVTEMSSGRKNCSSIEKSSRVASERTKLFGQYSIIAPTEVRIRDVCCVGLSTHDNLRIQNPTEHWIRVKFEVVKITINGSEITDCSVCPFALKNHSVIEPNHTQEIKVVFVPRFSGVFVAQLYLHCGPVWEDETLQAYDKFPVMVTLQAIAEKPLIQVSAEGTAGNILHLGNIPWNCHASGAISLINRGRANVPVRLTVTSVSGNSCFSFEKRSENSLSKIPNKRHPVASLIYSCTLPSMDATSCLKPTVVPIHFVAPNRQQGAAEEIRARISAEVDTLTMPFHLGLVDLVAKAGTAKIHIPRPMKTVTLTDDEQSSCLVPLLNAGNIPITVGLKISKFCDIFEVCPTEISLEPNEEKKVRLLFKPPFDSTTTIRFESILLISINPDGPLFKISLIAVRKKLMESSALTQPKDPCEVILSQNEASESEFGHSGKSDSKHVRFEVVTKSQPQVSTPDCYITQFLGPNGATKDIHNQDLTDVLVDKQSCVYNNYIIPDISSPCQDFDNDSHIHTIPERDTGRSSLYPVLTTASELEGNDSDEVRNQTVSNGNDLWTVKPDRLILPSSHATAFYEPAIKRFKITNHTTRNMPYKLIWPEKYITVTPEEGTVLQRSSTIVCISANNDLEEKEGLNLPWSGSICVTTDDAIKHVDVTIILNRTACNKKLVDGPFISSNVIIHQSGKLGSVVIPRGGPQNETIQHLGQKRLNFHPTIVRDATEEIFILKNLSSSRLKWNMNAFAPVYIKKPWQMGCSRLPYSVFWLPTQSGIIDPNDQVEVVVCFCPLEVGHFSQFWEVFFEIENSPTTTAPEVCRIELFAHSMSEVDAVSTASDSNIFDGTDETGGSQPCLSICSRSSDLPSRDSVLSVNPMELDFPTTSVNKKTSLKLMVKNHDTNSYFIEISAPDQPFYARHKKIKLERRHFLFLPFDFLPRATGCYTSQMVLKSENGDSFVVKLKGLCQ